MTDCSAAERTTGLEVFVADVGVQLFAAFRTTVGLDVIDLARPTVMGGIFIGAMLPFLFAGLTWYFATLPQGADPVSLVLITAVVVGSLTTSYVRARAEVITDEKRGRDIIIIHEIPYQLNKARERAHVLEGIDRKSVVEGKSVDLGGRRIIKKTLVESGWCCGGVKLRRWERRVGR